MLPGGTIVRACKGLDGQESVGGSHRAAAETTLSSFPGLEGPGVSEGSGLFPSHPNPRLPPYS